MSCNSSAGNETDLVVCQLQALLVSDFGPRITIKIVESLREDILGGKLKSGSEIKNFDRIVPPSPSIELDSAATFFNRAYTVKFEINHSQLRLTKKDNGAYDELVETIYEQTWVSRDKAELKLTSHVKTEDDTVTLSIMSDDDVEFVIIHKEKASNDQAMPVSTTKHAVVDDNDSSESIDISGRSNSSKTSDTEDEIGDNDGGQPATEDGTEERRVSRTPNSSSPSMNTQWTVSESGLNDNYNIEFRRVSSYVIGDLFASKFGNPGCHIRPKDIVSEMREQHGIHHSYNKTYRSKVHALNQVFGDPWESFQRLPAYFYVLEQSNPRTVIKIKIDSKNWFKYGFMAIGASIEGFNSIIRPVIYIDATHLKARTMGVLLVSVCKDENEMIYPLAFEFANSECTESWTWFLKKLRKLIQYPDRVILVSDRHNGIFNAMEAIIPDAAHGICAYHLAQNLKNLKRFCKQRDDVIWLYYHATYVYRIEEFDHTMAELKET
ncbi:hypothetical protein Dsin_017586 [Dipteronia sinensis]|uniref:MULE transposase domain-containing protein n=1 Tax=Dipteronia sinensis TaxID=43782 RepID=A0AAE0AFD3_9ROSI|nr:hypothetical protein Dsin_017586 [Dipteronia sinensis]